MSQQQPLDPRVSACLELLQQADKYPEALRGAAVAYLLSELAVAPPPVVLRDPGVAGKLEFAAALMQRLNDVTTGPKPVSVRHREVIADEIKNNAAWSLCGWQSGEG